MKVLQFCWISRLRLHHARSLYLRAFQTLLNLADPQPQHLHLMGTWSYIVCAKFFRRHTAWTPAFWTALLPSQLIETSVCMVCRWVQMQFSSVMCLLLCTVYYIHRVNVPGFMSLDGWGMFNCSVVATLIHGTFVHLTGCISQTNVSIVPCSIGGFSSPYCNVFF